MLALRQQKVLDAVQGQFLSFIGLTWSEAFLTYNVAPLSLRRSIALLGFIYRCVRRLAPAKCCELFELDQRQSNLRSSERLHPFQLKDPVGPGSSPLLCRSLWGLVAFWNHLPLDTITAPMVKDFQKLITEGARDAVRSGYSKSDLCALHFIHVRYGVETHN